MRLLPLGLCLLVSVAPIACDDGGGGSGGAGATTTTTTSATTSTSTSTSTSTTTSTTSTTTTTTSSGGGGGQGGATSSTSSAGGGGAGGSGGEGGSGGAPPSYGTCALPCAAAADCCAGNANCLIAYPYFFACDPVDGACQNLGCTGDADCAASGDNLKKCVDIGAAHTCARFCAVDADCGNPLLKCLGNDINGSLYCIYGSPECAVDGDCGGSGKCVNQKCLCASSAECSNGVSTACDLP